MDAVCYFVAVVSAPASLLTCVASTCAMPVLEIPHADAGAITTTHHHHHHHHQSVLQCRCRNGCAGLRDLMCCALRASTSIRATARGAAIAHISACILPPHRCLVLSITDTTGLTLQGFPHHLPYRAARHRIPFVMPRTRSGRNECLTCRRGVKCPFFRTGDTMSKGTSAVGGTW